MNWMSHKFFQSVGNYVLGLEYSDYSITFWNSMKNSDDRHFSVMMLAFIDENTKGRIFQISMYGTTCNRFIIFFVT